MIRSTGPRSLNTRIHGGCSDIAEQLLVPKALVYQVICLEAAEEEIIPLVPVMGRMVPEHESRWEVKQAMDVVELIHKRAATLGLFLREYNEDGEVRRVWYGQPERSH